MYLALLAIEGRRVTENENAWRRLFELQPWVSVAISSEVVFHEVRILNWNKQAQYTSRVPKNWRPMDLEKTGPCERRNLFRH